MMAFTKNNNLLFLLLILLVGFFLRFYNLGTENIWYDEGVSIYVAKKGVTEIALRPENNPPLYYLVLHWWVSLFGDSEFSVRFPSALFGVLSLIGMYKVGSQLFDRNAGLFSALLLAVSSFHIMYSQEARTYSLSSLLTLLSMYFFIELVRKRRLRDSVGYVISSALLLYSHVYGLFIIVAQNSYLIGRFLFSKMPSELSFKKWIFLQGMVLSLFAPWVKILVTQTMRAVGSGTGLRRPDILTIINSFLTYGGSSYLAVLFLIFAPLSLITFEKMSGKIDWRRLFQSLETYRWKIKFSHTEEVFFLTLWFFTPIMLPIVISRFGASIYHIRYTIVAFCAFYLLVARAMSIVHRKYVKFLVAAIVLLAGIELFGYYHDGHKEQWRDAVHYVESSADSKDLILFNDPVCGWLLFDYYSSRADLVKRGFPETRHRVDEESIGELRPMLDGHRRVWFIVSHSTDKKGLIMRTLNDSFHLASHKQYRGIDAYLFERKDAG